jgi:type I restriction enzyme S subunit
MVKKKASGFKSMKNKISIKELLEGIGLPAGRQEVEWKLLSGGDNPVAELRRGRVMSKTYLADNTGNYPVYSSQTANNGEIGKIDTFDFDGEFVSWTTDGANAGTVFYRTGKFSITNVCGLIKINNETELSYKFLFYWLSTEAKKHVYSGMGNPKLMSHQVSKIPIPIPSLPIQNEIVRILDNFTELTAELRARQKQYSYYLDKLLAFEESKVEFKLLKDLCNFSYGLTAKAQESGNARFVRISDITSKGKLSKTNAKYVDISIENDKYILKKDDLLMARTGATYGKTMIYEESPPSVYAGFLIKLSFDKNINPKYYWHFAQSSLFWYQANKLVSGGGQPQFNANALKEVKVPIPYPNDPDKSLIEQQRIVSILDKFDTLTNSISDGLPYEIELRQKQYEYYRDLLLTFPKATQ